MIGQLLEIRIELVFIFYNLMARLQPDIVRKSTRIMCELKVPFPTTVSLRLDNEKRVS